MPVAPLALPSRSPGDTTTQGDVDALVAKTDELSAAVGLDRLGIPSRIGTSGSLRTYQNDIAAITGRINRIAGLLGLGALSTCGRTCADGSAAAGVVNELARQLDVIIASAAPPRVHGLTPGTVTATTQLLSWAPATRPGFPTTGYVVHAKAPGDLGRVTAHPPEHPDQGRTVAELLPGTTYEYRVAAVNAVGTGPSSTPRSATTAGVAPHAFSSIADDFTRGHLAPFHVSAGVVDLVHERALLQCGLGYTSLTTAAAYTLANSSIYARLYPPRAGSASRAATVAMQVRSATPGTFLEVSVNRRTNTIDFSSNVNYSDAGQLSLPYQPAQHAWARLRESAGTVTFETSADALTWTRRRSVRTPGWLTSAANQALNFSAHRDGGAADRAGVACINRYGPDTVPPALGAVHENFAAGPGVFDNAAGSVVVTGGLLRISVSGGYDHAATDAAYRLAGSSVQALVVPPATSGAVTEASVSMTITSPVPGTCLNIVANSCDGTITFANMPGGYYDPTQVSMTYDPAAHAYWRIREKQGLVSFDTSPDQVSWTNRRAVATPPWIAGAATQALVFSTHRDTGSVNDAGVGHVNVYSSGQDTPPDGFTIGNNPPPAGQDLTVDFRTVTFPVDKWSIGATISTFGGYLVESQTWRDKLAALGPLTWRVPIKYNGGAPVSSAGGGDTSNRADAYISAIRAIGGTPYVVVGGNSDNTFSESDIAGLVHYFNDNNGARAGGRIERWVIGNEPGPDIDYNTYLSRLDGWIGAAKSADPAVLVSAPAFAYWNRDAIAQAAQHAGVDILSYHAYDGGNTDGTGFPHTSQYHDNVMTMRGMRSGLRYGLEEYNYSASGPGTPGFLDWRNTCFCASVIGQVLSAGGHAVQYADADGSVGLICDGGTADGQPGTFGTVYPAYVGIAMWTGMNGSFRRAAGSMVATAAAVNDIDVFATDNGKILAVNKDPADRTVAIALGGLVAGAVKVWQTSKNNPFALPSQQPGATYAGSILTLRLPGGTVSSIEF